ncbi:MAG TPA: RNA polymerase sigma factor [Vicinamibacterales bacterium]|nr:RNA polymerase sigma factor [Vicinamibacterales bacterium]
MQASDDAAVADARSGDREAFRTLVERHSRYLYGVAYRMTGNAEDARDVVQDTWLKAHSQLGRFEARANVRTWLTRIAINCAIDYLRRTRRHEAPGDTSADGRSWHEQPTLQPLPDRLVLAGEIGTRIEGTMRCLTTLERAAFVLRHVEGMSIDEIGNALGLNTSATKHSIFRAVRKMRVALAPFKEA